jgi:ParB-like chromosome segregation protein Spo0J|tara:strand:- start:7942 stop:8475 length:534 start_codon:yes stop_codon:yes gene_type:complete
MKKIDINKIKENSENPRYITEEKFEKLVESLKEFPEMLEVRELVVDENFVVLGGNMRLKALKAVGVKEVPYKQVKNWTEQQKREFIIKDNIGFGQWDWDILGNEWDNEELNKWGLQTYDIKNDIELDDFFEENTPQEKINTNVITLEYNDDDYKVINDILSGLNGSKEEIIYNLLTK